MGFGRPLRPHKPFQKVGQTHIKIDTDLAVAGTCNIGYDLVVGGRNILTELNTALALASPTITGTCNVNGSLLVQGVNILNELYQKQSSITRVEPAGGARGIQLWEDDVMRNIKAGRNTTITADWDALTISGLGNGGGALGGITRLINETSKNVKALKAGTGITLVDDATYDAITVSVPDLPTIQSNIALKANSDDVYAKTTLDGMLAQKQRTLWIGAPSVGVSLVDSGYIVPGLNATTPLSVSKASGVITIASDTYSKAEINTLLSGKESALTPVGPLNISYNLQGGTWDLKIDPTGAMAVGSLSSSGDVSVGGKLIHKPYASLLIVTSGGNVSVTNYGYCAITSANITRVGTNNKAYTVTFPAAHPNGINFGVFVTPYTTSSTSWDGTNDYIVTAKVEPGGVAISVWCRRPGLPPTTGLVDGSFFVHTVP